MGGVGSWRQVMAYIRTYTTVLSLVNDRNRLNSQDRLR